ncbi:MAG: porin [Odoribacteraceae bacterium]|jgi:hypothetical protein|nr:porin [Odoribacteraceae bacterium]
MRKKITIITFSIAIALASVTAARAQQIEAKFRPGNGLDILLDNGDYSFNIGGLIQSNFLRDDPAAAKVENKFGVKRGYLTLSGAARAERVHFLLRADLAASSPLLDAWLAWQPWKTITISAGQKQTFTNGREMTLPESGLSTPDRSPLSLSFAGTGREFGLFIEGDFELGNIPLLPAIAITSGDGQNAFGATSIDVDLGGLKYGARVDVLPLGRFAPVNDRAVADLAGERSPKLKIGLAASYNQGASHPAGHGHGAFALYDETGAARYPDYRLLHADLLFKYRGLSLLGEYANASATSLHHLYTAAGGTARLLPGQISHYLRLGDACNVQAGYAAKCGWGIDIRYARVTPEFEKEVASLLRRVELAEACVTKYFNGGVKVQGSFARRETDKQDADTRVEVMLQIAF